MAIILPSFVFASFHLIKGIGSIDVILMLIAGTTVGVMFSLVTYHKDNIWNAVIVHTVWNIVVIGIFLISPPTDFKNLVNYTTDCDSILITGGKYGVESGLPAIVSYVIVIIIVFSLYKVNKD